MNVGQVLETHLGWAAKGIGERLNEKMEASFNRAEIEEFILNIWQDDDIRSFVKSCTDDQLKSFVKKIP